MSTVYDNVFRTLIAECPEFLPPLLNEIFGEHYTGNEKITFAPNEQLQRTKDGEIKKHVTDTWFVVEGDVKKTYHLECQSTDDRRMLVRIVEYDEAIALKNRKEISLGTQGERLIVEFPNTAVMYLRSTEKTPAELEVEIKTPGGNVIYSVPVMKVPTYTIEEIFEKALWFLIPFYLFRYERNFAELEQDAVGLSQFQNEYAEIAERITSEPRLTEYEKDILADLSANVAEKLAKNYRKIREEVQDAMRGPIIITRARKLRDEGQREGRREGMLELLVSQVKQQIISIDIAAKTANMTVAEFRKLMEQQEKHCVTN